MAAIVPYVGIALPDIDNPFPHLKSEIDLILDSVVTILLTKLGQRWWWPDFCSQLWGLLFEPNDLVLVTLAQQYVRVPLGYWEKRVAVITVKVSQNLEQSIMTIQITLLIVRINNILDLAIQFSKDTGEVNVAVVNTTGS